MIQAPNDLYALYLDECHNPNYPELVVAFDHEGYAMILDMEAGLLTKASSITNFHCLRWMPAKDAPQG